MSESAERETRSQAHLHASGEELGHPRRFIGHGFRPRLGTRVVRDAGVNRESTL